MAAQHFTALFNRAKGDRSVIQIADEADVPLHWLRYLLKPSTELRVMPDSDRLFRLAYALTIPRGAVRAALALDIAGDAEPMPAVDPQTTKLLALWGSLKPEYRASYLAMGQSLTHLQRKLSGDAGDASIEEAS